MRFTFAILLLALVLSGIGCERLPVSPVGTDTFPPAIPEGVRISYAADGEVEIYWEENHESDVGAYYIYRRVDSLENIFILRGKTNDLYYFEDSLEYNLKYIYRVAATDYSGNTSALSDSVTAYPINLYVPRRPRNLVVYGQNREGKISVELSWGQSFESDIKHYFIYRGTNEAFSTDSVAVIGITNNTRYSDTVDLETGVIYHYKIKAIDKGMLESIESLNNSDIILPLPVIVFPIDGSINLRFYNVRVTGIPFAATYRLVLQNSENSGELWSFLVEHAGDSSEVIIPMQTYYLTTNRDYFFRLETYTKSLSFPNGITEATKFAIRN